MLRFALPVLALSLPASLHAQAAPAQSPRLDLSSLSDRESNLRTFLATHDSSIDAHYQLAFTLFREGKAKESLAEYTRSAQLRTPDARDLQCVALDYVLLHDYPDADRWMTRSVAGQPANAEAWYDLGRIKYTENRFDEAIAAFHKSLALDPRSVRAENNLGLSLEGLNKLDEAVAAYRQAIAWQDGVAHPSEQPFINLAMVLMQREQTSEALKLLQQANTLSPRDPKIQEQLGRAYAKADRLADAEGALEKAAALKPDHAAVHFELGQVYRKEAKAEKAKQEFAQAASLSAAQTGAERDKVRKQD